MSDWLDLTAADLLLFSPETYWRLFELHNLAFWPAHGAIVGVLATAVVLALAGRGQARIAAAAGLAAAWGLVAQAFLVARFAPINWAIDHVWPLFWAQALLLALLLPGLRFSVRGPARALAAGIAVAAFLYPLVGMAAGRPLVQSEVAGLAPDPTAVLTLGLLGFAEPGWRRLVLSVVPVLWLAASAAMLLTMGASTGWVPVGALCLALLGPMVTAIFARRRGRRAATRQPAGS